MLHKYPQMILTNKLTNRPVLSEAYKNRGFTLLELAIVVIVSGFLLGTVTNLYLTYAATNRYHSAVEKLNVIHSSLDGYSIVSGRLPFPADPTLPASSPDAGCECGSCRDTAAACNTLLLMPFGCSPSGGICKAPGARSTAVNPNPGAGNDPVYSGAVPYKTIRGTKSGVLSDTVAMNDTLDPWSYQAGYAVSSAATNAMTYRQGVYGAIDVATENGIELTDPAGAVNFIIISYGDNHMGAYSAAGKKNKPCVAGTMDYANCNHGSKFVSGLRSLGSNKSYFDDIVQYSLPTRPKLWDFTAVGSNNIHNLNSGNVGIGVPQGKSAEQMLEVDGTINIANNGGAYAASICNLAGANCWKPNLLAGPQKGTNPSGNLCTPVGGMSVATGLSNGKVNCKTLPLLTVAQNQACPAGHFVIGFSATSGLLCQ